MPRRNVPPLCPYRLARDPKTGETVVEVAVTGRALLGLACLNKGTAFTEEERRELGLLGLLPHRVLPIEQQAQRMRREYLRESTDIERHLFLSALHDQNETLFLRLVRDHLTEMMPIIYTPVVGEIVRQYSRLYRGSRGLYLAYPDRDRMDEILDHWMHPVVDAVCVTDGEAILGLGDQGAGGIAIPIAKLVVYTLLAGVRPHGLMPVMLDVGTDNPELLEDPLYLGWRHERLRGEAYDSFVDQFVQAVRRRWPGAILHWEDFGKTNARRLLDRYRWEICSFNDDIQGTAAVALAALIAANGRAGSSFREQRAVVHGAGTAGVGIADEIVAAMLREGLPESEALDRVWLLNSRGLLLEDSPGLEPFQRRYAKPRAAVSGWRLADPARIGLEDVVRNVHPTVLIGTSTQAGAFTEPIVREMASRCSRPIVFPLSNPDSKAEARPEDLLRWTDGRALVATGTPFPDVPFQGRSVRIGNCNNAFVFPGLALGAIASRARAISDGMVSAAGIEIGKWIPGDGDPLGPLMPALEDARAISRNVAIAVGLAAQREGLAEKASVDELERRIAEVSWTGGYHRYRRWSG
ncbi:MAG: NAD-dependent malic enzyme [Fimbriimonadales bacterium]|nr:NAD-dependent malic enzyme [Fimbriimonadales bacterium]